MQAPINPEEVFNSLPIVVRENLVCYCKKGSDLRDGHRLNWTNPSKGKKICSVCPECSKANKYSVQVLAEICEICSNYYLMTFNDEGERNDRGRCPDCTAGAEVHPAFKGSRSKFSFS